MPRRCCAPFVMTVVSPTYNCASVRRPSWPAKWVAKLRSVDTGPRRILLRTEMKAGHGGKSGRFERYHQTAEWYVFLLEQTGGL